MLPQTTAAADRQLPWRQLGKVVLGKKSDKGFPQDLNYFLIKEKNRSGEYIVSKRYHDILGEQPNTLDIMLPHADLGMIFDSRANWYGSNGARKCFTNDGLRAQRFMELPGQTGPQDKRKHGYVEIECPNTECEFRVAKNCQAKNIFHFMIGCPGIPIGGFFMDFGSKVAAAQILATLNMAEGLCRQLGREQGLFGLRFKLRRTPTTFHIPSSRRPGEQDKVVKYIPMLELDFASLRGEDQALLGPWVGRLEANAGREPLLIDHQEATLLDGESVGEQQ